MPEAHKTPQQINRDDWIRDIIESSAPLVDLPLELPQTYQHQLITAAIEAAYSNGPYPTRRTRLAAAFDLVISAEYYRHVSHAGWLYCPETPDGPKLFYPYTNVCPGCVLRGQFAFHEANKPSSGRIGYITSHILSLYLRHLLRRKRQGIRVLKGREPVDLVLIDDSTVPKTVLFAEIKAAPLVTLPLAVASQELTVEAADGSLNAAHRGSDYSSLFGTNLTMLVPVYDADSASWASSYFTVGSKHDKADEQWAYRGLTRLLSNSEFLDAYFTFWTKTLQCYGPRDQSPVFWLTNACGHPSPRPDDWPRRSYGAGYESISDSKTSVGMDRTDDLKKATYQVLKIGAQGHPSNEFSYKVGIVSNIYAVRHFEEYLASLVDIIWTRDAAGTAQKANDLPPDTPLFDLFDGIITLTNLIARDEWIASVFDF